MSQSDKLAAKHGTSENLPVALTHRDVSVAYAGGLLFFAKESVVQNDMAYNWRRVTVLHQVCRIDAIGLYLKGLELPYDVSVTGVMGDSWHTIFYTYQWKRYIMGILLSDRATAGDIPAQLQQMYGIRVRLAWMV